MFVGRYGIVAVSLLPLINGGPLGATEPSAFDFRLIRPAYGSAPLRQQGAPDADCPDEVAASASHRRHAPGNGAEPEMKTTRRLAGWPGDTDSRIPVVERSTLADVMRRVALWGDCCPLCGQSHAEQKAKETEGSRARETAAVLRRGFTANADVGLGDAPRRAATDTLRAGEPAQVILDTQQRLGKSVLDGTEFSGSPEVLIEWIRALDEESCRRQAMPEESSPAEVEAVPEKDPASTAHSQVDALRKASRSLQEAAELLEEQNLFEAADSIRGLADGLRRQSRRKIKGLEMDDPCLSDPQSRPAKASD